MAWLVLSNKMDVCYLLVYVQEIRIQPYFCVKQGDYFFPLFPKDSVREFEALLRKSSRYFSIQIVLREISWIEHTEKGDSKIKMNTDCDNLSVDQGNVDPSVTKKVSKASSVFSNLSVNPVKHHVSFHPSIIICLIHKH